MKTKLAKIMKANDGGTSLYSPQLKLGWWIFKRWRSIHVVANNNYMKKDACLLFDSYDEAMENFKEYKKLTGNDYKLTHPRPLGI